MAIAPASLTQMARASRPAIIGLYRMIGVYEGAGTAVSTTYEYTAQSQRGRMTRRSGSITGYSYDGAQRLASLSQQFAGNAGNVTLGFAYNPASQITLLSQDNDSFVYALVAKYNSADIIARRFVHRPGVDDPLVWCEGAEQSI
jgi:YD repeat-containing protein